MMRKLHDIMKSFYVVAAACLLPLSLKAQAWDDKVFIDHCTDDYELKMSGGTPIARNVQKFSFESNSNKEQVVQASCGYGEYVSLDVISGAKESVKKSFTPEGIFFDDSKLCVAKNVLKKKGAKVRMGFTRTFKDIKYFTRIDLLESYYVRSKVVTIRIPKSFAGYRLKDINFNGYHIEKNHQETASEDIYTYEITDAKPFDDDQPYAPQYSHVSPTVLVIGSFADVQELYNWSRSMEMVDCKIPNLQNILKEINVNSKTPEDRISNTYEWVQKNIRYVAFEAGISGHQPDTPAEVIRKRYGDCKGMGLLLTTLLKAQNFDARLTDIGTEDIPFKASEVPTLAAHDHVICTLFYKGKTYYLDATCNYIPWNYWPQSIQGSEAMIENGTKPDLKIVPVLSESTSLDSLCYHYRLQGNKLVGKVSYHLCGDMKEYFMQTIENAGNKNENELLTNNLNADSHNMKISNVGWKDRDRRHRWSIFGGDVENEVAVQTVDGEKYIELNPHNNMFASRIDTTDRHCDFEYPIRCNVVRQAELTLPAGAKVTYMPKPFSIKLPGAVLSCTFTRKGNVIVYHQKLRITKKVMKLADLPKWNEALGKWRDACNEQIIIK